MGKQEDIIARMRHRITIEKPELTPEAGGQFTVQWQEVVTVWAEILPIETRIRYAEMLVDGQLTAPVSHVVTLRYHAGVSAEMRVVFGGRVFNIRHVVNIGEENRFLRLLAEEHAGD